jgi:hypothetical protein
MYAGAIVYLVSMPLLLGSRRGLTLTTVLIVALAGGSYARSGRCAQSCLAMTNTPRESATD